MDWKDVAGLAHDDNVPPGDAGSALSSSICLGKHTPINMLSRGDHPSIATPVDLASARLAQCMSLDGYRLDLRPVE